MSSALLKIAKILRRDFSELEKIQNSKQNLEKFVFKSIQNVKESLKIDLIKARSEAEIFFVEDKANTGQKDYFFLVDPVSGTKNYSHGISYFASSIILIIEGESIASVIYDPIRDEMFYAEKGKGAYYSSGSRPNQTATSWGKARMYSYIMGGPTRKIDQHITDKYNVKLP